MIRRLFLAVVFLVAACTPPGTQATKATDEAAIAAIVTKLDEAVDKKDWPAARAAFTDQIEVDLSSLGGEPSKVPADELVGNWKANLPPGKSSFHMLSAPTIAVDGDSATFKANGYAWNKLDTRAENNLWEVWGVYQHKLTRTPEGWKISSFGFHKTNERGDPTIRDAQPGVVVPLAGEENDTKNNKDED
jgi:hypothetical protein